MDNHRGLGLRAYICLKALVRPTRGSRAVGLVIVVIGAVVLLLAPSMLGPVQVHAVNWQPQIQSRCAGTGFDGTGSPCFYVEPNPVILRAFVDTVQWSCGTSVGSLNLGFPNCSAVNRNGGPPFDTGIFSPGLGPLVFGPFGPGVIKYEICMWPNPPSGPPTPPCPAGRGVDPAIQVVTGFGGSVGGDEIPVNKMSLLAPYVAVAALLLSAGALTVLHVVRVRHRKNSH